MYHAPAVGRVAPVRSHTILPTPHYFVIIVKLSESGIETPKYVLKMVLQVRSSPWPLPQVMHLL